tara:strand:- start:406 stop:1092 length:687 start_codon:yes stop_codon:yes gene_type:complete
MNFGIVVFPGTWSDRDCDFALKSIDGINTSYLWHKETNVKGIDAIVLPGGFSHGDYLRAGAIASHSPIMKEIVSLSKKGMPVIGICNGFQILCESGLLPGALIRNKSLKFKCCDVHLKTNLTTNFSKKIKKDSIIKIPISHGEGNYQASNEDLDSLKNNDQILFTYCSKDGDQGAQNNPNGSALNIAGITNIQGNVLGMMPHPERSSSLELGSEDGNLIFESMFNSFS